MSNIADHIVRIKEELPSGVKLVAVSKYRPVEELMEAYDAGQRVFGENRPQELSAKYPVMPKDIEWHFIGHLQTNKLKMVLPFASLVQSVDSVHLLEAIEKWGEQNDKVIDILLELHLGAEETKHGLTPDEVKSIVANRGDYPHIRIHGLMGMATNTSDEDVIRADFARISALKKEIEASWSEFKELSIGMSGDYLIAIEYGATIVRVGHKIFTVENE